MAQRTARPVLVPAALLLLGLAAILLLTIPTEDVREPPGFMSCNVQPRRLPFEDRHYQFTWQAARCLPDAKIEVRKYGIVLDAGSSHTALYIYKWPADKQNGTGVVTQHNECHVKGGGISSYAGQQGAAGQSLEACLNQAVKDIPKDKHMLTPVYLGATAGMRLLHISSPTQSNQILEEVGHKIQSYPFSYRGAAILSGQEEGAYGWVTVNYLLENFIKYGFVGHWLSSSRPTVGALDFGGASTQITFVTQEKVEDERDMMKLRLYGQEYSLYTHSFLCYGQDQFLKRLLAHILKSQDYPETVTHPCYPADHRRVLKLNNIFNSPCTEASKPSSYNPQASLTIQGSGHYEHCLGNVSELFVFGSCSYSQCSLDKVFQPNVTGSFMAFSAYYYIHSFLKQVTGITARTPDQLEEAVKSVCGKTFKQMSILAPEQKSRLQDYCASSVFLKVLTLRGYGFDNTSFPRISFQKKAGDTSVGWALGYMLSLSSLLPAETVALRKALTPAAWGALISLFVLLLVAVLVFILLRARDWRKKGGGEGPI